jgi:hypothetical protein
MPYGKRSSGRRPLTPRIRAELRAWKDSARTHGLPFSTTEIASAKTPVAKP